MASTHDVLRRWREHNEEHLGRGRLSTRSLRFEGPLLYSYRAAIARYWGSFVLVSDGNWSRTTARHVSQARSEPNFPVFMVEDVHSIDTPDNFNKLILTFRTKLDEYRRKYLQTHDTGWRFTYMRGEVDRAYRAAADYQRTTKCAGDLPDFDALIAEADQHRQAKLDHYNSPAEVAKRERKAARREALQAMDLPEAKETD